MSRTLRIIVFGGLVLAAWCFSSDQLLSRVASDEGYDEEAAPAAFEQNESDYQVVKLLSKLFTSIKRNHVEVKNLHRQYLRANEPAERSGLRRQMQERIAFVEGKAREYQQLAPSLQQSYPGLKSVIQSFTRDLTGISGDLDLIRQTDQLAGRPERAAGPRKRDARPNRTGQLAAEEPKQEAPALPEGGMMSQALEYEREEAQRAETTEHNASAAGGMEMTPGGPVVPITLEVRGERGEKINRRKIVFQVADNKKAGMKGFVAAGNLVREAIAFTDAAGRAVVRLQLEPSENPLRIKRTILPREDHTVCLLEAVEAR